MRSSVVPFPDRFREFLVVKQRNNQSTYVHFFEMIRNDPFRDSERICFIQKNPLWLCTVIMESGYDFMHILRCGWSSMTKPVLTILYTKRIVSCSSMHTNNISCNVYFISGKYSMTWRTKGFDWSSLSSYNERLDAINRCLHVTNQDSMSLLVSCKAMLITSGHNKLVHYF